MSATKFHTHTKQQEKIIVLYILIFKFLDSNLLKTKGSAPNDSKHVSDIANL